MNLDKPDCKKNTIKNSLENDIIHDDNNFLVMTLDREKNQAIFRTFITKMVFRFSNLDDSAEPRSPRKSPTTSPLKKMRSRENSINLFQYLRKIKTSIKISTFEERLTKLKNKKEEVLKVKYETIAKEYNYFYADFVKNWIPFGINYLENFLNNCKNKKVSKLACLLVHKKTAIPSDRIEIKLLECLESITSLVHKLYSS